MERNEMLSSHYRRRLKSERRGKIASEWADVLRKVVNLDGYSRDDVRITLGWLLKTDNWWKSNRTIQSLGSLRKSDEDGTTKFDKILQSALADYEQRHKQRTDPEAIRDGFAPSERDSGEPRPAGSTGDSIPDEQEVELSGFEW